MVSRKASSRKASSRKASSRKASSRKASSRKASSIDSLLIPEQKKNNYEFNILGLIINILIIYYLINIEAVDCNCINDWRHNYIKYVSVFNIIINILFLFNINNESLLGINTILNLINLYAFFTYIRDLNDTKCECAIKQKSLNSFLNIWRYIIIIMIILGLIYISILLSYFIK
jgi:hypothetical protein